MVIHKAFKYLKFSILPMGKRFCISCKRDVSTAKDSVIFDCPNCGKTEIVRCGSCRKLVVPYTCPECGFEGP
jgi:predicted RNA-binding Zn-ribbon protein involved in translation (DUF1610 family)